MVKLRLKPPAQARVIYPNGMELAAIPNNKRHFSLKEVQTLVGGYVELVRLSEEQIMLVDEEGKLKGNPINEKATAIAHAAGLSLGDEIVGVAIVCHPDMFR